MKPTKFFPDFEALVGPSGASMHDTETGFLAEWDATTHVGGVLHPPTHLVPIRTALAFEANLHRMQGKPTPLMSGDKHDTTPSTHTTGGGRRSFISTGFQRHLRGLSDGLPALVAWANDQRPRPVCDLPYDWKYDGYYGRLVSGQKYDSSVNGWNVFDPAHLESAPLYSGAVLGSEESLANFLWLCSWVVRTYAQKQPDGTLRLQKAWDGSGQPRARGWGIFLCAHACLVGFDTADAESLDFFFGGVRPKELLVAMLKQLVANPPGWGAGNIDPRCMPLVPATYGWQEAIQLAGVGYALLTGIINPPLAVQVRELFAQHAAEMVKRAFGPDPARGGKTGVAYAFSATEHEAATLAAIQAADSSKVYEFAPGTNFIRSVPRMADAELSLGGLFLLNGVTDPAVVSLMASLPGSTQMSAYDDTSRYCDPAWAALE